MILDRKTTANVPKTAYKANLNRASRLVREPPRPANAGENPRKRWALQNAIRSCSRLFVGLEIANGPEGEQTVGAGGKLTPLA